MARPPGSDPSSGSANTRGAAGTGSARRRVLRACAIFATGLLLPSAGAQEANVPSAAASLYVRTDSDQTTVITPRLRVGAPLAEATRFDLVYLVDVWTSASIDIRTSATRRVDQPPGEIVPVTEQRDEIDAALQHAFTDVTVSGNYRYSTEYDYESHGGGVNMAYDFADNNAQLALGVQTFFDEVGRAGDPGFSEPSTMVSARAAFTQVLDPETLVQLIYELTRQNGFLSSPYRFVRIADDVGAVPSTCRYPATYVPRTLRGCEPENNPDSRLRHAAALAARRALSDSIAAGVSYRFYIDDWDVTSHTAAIDATLSVDPAWLFGLGYRFYRQGAASHFASFYPAMPLPQHYTSDKELSTFSSHRLELEISRGFGLGEPGSELRAVLRGTPTYYVYDDYELLDSVTAFELTFALGVTL